MRPFLIPALAFATAGCATVTPPAITRTVNPGGTIPIATSVRVPAGSDIVFLSGMLPAVANPQAPPNTPDSYGDTKTQTASVLDRLKTALEAEGLTFADVVSVRVFLVGDPRIGGGMDFAGLNASFGQHFGTAAQPNKPARTTLQVVALPAPGALVEIDVVAARPK
ncbi:MAG: RidA family protein [Hyphomonadaceae bacterium]|nr:RidA family protein [Hyphomonadaceae bacterium]